MAAKIPWSGKFTINNEDRKETAEAYTDEQALFFMARKIARKKHMNARAIISYLKSHPHSYEIKKANN